jgi:hypothetical protein
MARRNAQKQTDAEVASSDAGWDEGATYPLSRSLPKGAGA